MTYLGEGDAGYIGPYVSSRDPSKTAPNDVRETEIVVPQENMRLMPYTAVRNKDESQGDRCLCTHGFTRLSAAVPVLMSASFPALAPGIDTISLDVPGFPVIENLPVTRG